MRDVGPTDMRRVPLDPNPDGPSPRPALAFICEVVTGPSVTRRLLIFTSDNDNYNRLLAFLCYEIKRGKMKEA